MTPTRTVLCLLSWSLLVGCGPNVSEVRTVNYPPKEKNCSLEFVKLDNQTMSGQGPWEAIGQVVLHEHGKEDPFDEENKAIVRPRACQMGGEAVAIAMHATSETVISSGTAISYAILRKRAAQAEAPKQF